MKKEEVVLLINQNYYPSIGGVENSLRSLSEALTAENKKVLVVTSDVVSYTKSKLSRHEKLFGADVYRFYHGFLPFSIFSCVKLLIEIKKRFSIEAVISRSNLTTICCKMAGLNDVKYLAPGVHRFQNALEYSSSRSLKSYVSYYLHDLIERINYGLLNDVYVFSRQMEYQVLKIKKDIVVNRVFPGVDRNRFFVPTAHEKNIIRIKHGLPLEKKLLLFIGRIELVKNPIDAVKILLELNKDFLLVFVGEGSYLSVVKNYVEKNNASARVLFKSATNLPEEFYKASDGFIMTSTYESFGQTVIEALHCGLPVFGYLNDDHNVMTAITEVLDSLSIDDENRYLVCYDENRILKLSSLINSSELKPILVKKDFSWFNLYRKVMSK